MPSLTQIPNKGPGFVSLGDPQYRYIRTGLWPIFLGAFVEWFYFFPDHPFEILNGCARDGSSPPRNPEHSGGNELDIKYQLDNGKPNPFPAFFVLARWENLHPDADLKVLMYEDYIDEIKTVHWNLFNRVSHWLRGTQDDDCAGDREHKFHWHVSVMKLGKNV